MKLSQKVLLLIALPLAFELLFVGVLIYFIFQLDAEHKRSEKTRAASMFFNIELENMVEAMGNMVLFNVLHEERYLQKFHGSVDALKKQNEHLKTLAGTEMAADVQALKTVSEEAIASITDIEKLARTDDRIDMLRGFVKVQRLMAKSNALGSKFIQRETLVNEQQQARQAQALQAVLLIIVFGVGTSVLISLLLVAKFNSGASKQLVAIEDNMLRLAVQKPLKPPADGSDELARIDQTLFRLSNDLADLKNQQQQVYAMITHDLRSPLASMKIVFDLLKAGAFGELNEKGKDRIKNSDALLGRMVALTNDLLDVEKFESGSFDLLMERVELAEIFEDAKNIVGPKAEGKKLRLAFDSNGLDAVCDKERIGRVLVNLLDNAVKFSKHESEIKVAATADTSFIKISVQDFGRGIPAEQIAHVFERFHQASRSDELVMKGSGLGLTISKAIIEAHKGTIGVDSIENSGSTFWFTLPKSSGTAV